VQGRPGMMYGGLGRGASGAPGLVDEDDALHMLLPRVTRLKGGVRGEHYLPGLAQQTYCFSKSSRYAKNPLWLLTAHLHRSLAQAPKACTRKSVLHNAPNEALPRTAEFGRSGCLWLIAG
jgi:hypothetical protein